VAKKLIPQKVIAAAATAPTTAKSNQYLMLVRS